MRSWECWTIAIPSLTITGSVRITNIAAAYAGWSLKRLTNTWKGNNNKNNIMEHQSKSRKLPVYNIEGTDFYVDVRLNEFREVGAPWNTISLTEIGPVEDGISGLVYDTGTKN